MTYRRIPSRYGTVRVWVGGPVPPGSAAITLGRLIIVRRAAADDGRLLRHEMVHVGQWHDLGVFGFLRSYLGAYFAGRRRGLGHTDGHRAIPLEVEAELGSMPLAEPPGPG
ncbi:MAG: hypothetical protein ACRDY5_00130 [Acidimicrobiales bacterium]